MEELGIITGKTDKLIALIYVSTKGLVLARDTAPCETLYKMHERLYEMGYTKIAPGEFTVWVE